MKKPALIFFVFLLSVTTAYACEICGCSHSNFQIGLLPTFNNGFVGFRYSYTTFDSQMKHEPDEYSKDQYQTMELWGGYNFKKLQVMAFMPYSISQKENDEGTTHFSGIGDLMVLVNYNILNSTSLSENEKTTVRHELYLGGGIKLPTGVTEVNSADPSLNIGDFNSQAGTGSVDYILNATYNAMWNKSGIVTNVAYRINTESDDEYKYGNRLYASSAYFYTITKSELKIKPNAGFNLQSNAINTFQGSEVEDSNGYTLASTLGINVLRNKIGFNALVFVPMVQDNYDGQTKLKSRILLGVTYSF